MGAAIGCREIWGCAPRNRAKQKRGALPNSMGLSVVQGSEGIRGLWEEEIDLAWDRELSTREIARVCGFHGARPGNQ